MVGIFLFLLLASVDASPYSLKQVLILGRHNVRSPIRSSYIQKFTPKEGPQWNNVTDATLTPKGALMEEYMADYFKEWLKYVGFLSETCSKRDDVYIRSSFSNRTFETARIFTNVVFENCNITVYNKGGRLMNFLFDSFIHNSSEAHKDEVINDIKKKLDELDLNSAYLELNRVLDLENSEVCRNMSICDLTSVKDDVLYRVGDEPILIGRLQIANCITDSILMAYYNNVPLDSIAIGDENLEVITAITKAYENVKFNTTSVAKDVSRPLIKKIATIFLNNHPKFTLLVGHDSNLHGVMRYLNFKPYQLPNSYENTPVGGKLIFQKWYNKDLNRDLLKVNYVYQTKDQIRNNVKLSLVNPPNWVVMEMEECHIDNSGFCLWDDFLNILKSF